MQLHFFFLLLYQNDYQSSGSASTKWRLAPTRREQEKWDRASKAATGGSVCRLNGFAVQFWLNFIGALRS